MYDKLEYYLSESRLRPYLELANNDKEKAVELYELNLKYISKLLIPISCLEVVLRNCINNIMIFIDKYWLINFETLNDNLLSSFKIKIKNHNTIKSYIKFFNKQNEMIRKAKENLENKEKTNNNILSELTFGFWVRLFNRKYDILWNKYFYNIFNKRVKRKDIEITLYELRSLRNKIAHNGCIINQEISPTEYYQIIINFVSEIDIDIADWIKGVAGSI